MDILVGCLRLYLAIQHREMHCLSQDKPASRFLLNTKRSSQLGAKPYQTPASASWSCLGAGTLLLSSCETRLTRIWTYSTLAYGLLSLCTAPMKIKLRYVRNRDRPTPLTPRSGRSNYTTTLPPTLLHFHT
ncbi:hypothetical protein EJ05DRAFT_471898 [Pseudovirgaria hyperparasitica]|uniref:Uncharacterized protein n=1 Tax=Pseudovirgaria hyperparasitica TaxID=470096 RepID=A0A6A6WL82_9PEZI|nr:uncharacterized protein EJ05DRAFT_471898 [Pseudovirgaria hyperparasitica]KAF2762932.1 hypothetical protein EJ05DRAFT_471898 [Pseudovirgaria hyperparasitica]